MKTLSISKNDFFSFPRFAKLFRKHTVESSSTYLISILVLFGIMTCIFGFLSYVSNGYLTPTIQGRTYIVLLIFAGPIFTSMIFSDLGDRNKAIPILTLPVSNFERYLVAWLYSFIIFLLVYTLCFYASAFMMLKIAQISDGASVPLVNIITDAGAYWKIFNGYFLLHAVFFLGAVLFKKQHFIRISFASFLGIMLIYFINYAIGTVIFGTDIAKVVPFDSIDVLEGSQRWTIQLQDASYAIETSIIIFSVAVLWVCVYFKVKEREV